MLRSSSGKKRGKQTNQLPAEDSDVSVECIEMPSKKEKQIPQNEQHGSSVFQQSQPLPFFSAFNQIQAPFGGFFPSFPYFGWPPQQQPFYGYPSNPNQLMLGNGDGKEMSSSAISTSKALSESGDEETEVNVSNKKRRKNQSKSNFKNSPQQPFKPQPTKPIPLPAMHSPTKNLQMMPAFMPYPPVPPQMFPFYAPPSQFVNPFPQMGWPLPMEQQIQKSAFMSAALPQGYPFQPCNNLGSSTLNTTAGIVRHAMPPHIQEQRKHIVIPVVKRHSSNAGLEPEEEEEDSEESNADEDEIRIEMEVSMDDSNGNKVDNTMEESERIARDSDGEKAKNKGQHFKHRQQKDKSATAKKDLEGEKCRVCGDASFGKYYGVVSCAACSSFFRRALVQAKYSKFVCKNKKQQCKIEKHNKAECTFCRFKRCESVGMRTDGTKGPKHSETPAEAGPKAKKQRRVTMAAIEYKPDSDLQEAISRSFQSANFHIKVETKSQPDLNELAKNALLFVRGFDENKNDTQRDNERAKWVNAGMRAFIAIRHYFLGDLPLLEVFCSVEDNPSLQQMLDKTNLLHLGMNANQNTQPNMHAMLSALAFCRDKELADRIKSCLRAQLKRQYSVKFEKCLNKLFDDEK